jgi:hypothetical protein
MVSVSVRVRVSREAHSVLISLFDDALDHLSDALKRVITSIGKKENK